MKKKPSYSRVGENFLLQMTEGKKKANEDG